MTAKAKSRGAVTLMGLFMVLILVAMLFMIIGIGRTIAMREGMQDAADAAAYSSAIFHARGMNLIAFINMVMAALVGVLVALRVAQTLMGMAAMTLGGLIYATAGLTAPAAAWATYQTTQFQQYFENAKNVIDPVLKGLHTTQEAVSVVVPWMAMADGMREAAAYHAPAKGAFALPGAASLPVESDEFSVLCGKGTETATRLALAPLKMLGGDKWLKPVYTAAEGIGESTSGYLCGDGSGTPPTHTQEYEESYPEPHGGEVCKTQPESHACREIRRDLEDAQPHGLNRPGGGTGECASHRCGYYDPYETMARKARLDCEPRAESRPSTYNWQEKRVVADFVWTGAEWRQEHRSVLWEKLHERRARPPCGPVGFAVINGEIWNRHSGAPDQEEPDPLCMSQVDELEFSEPPETGTRIDNVEFSEATRIFSCTFTRYERHALASEGDSLGAGDSEAKSPHKVEDDVDLGGEAFQIRALAFGEKPGPSEEAKQGVLVATNGRKWGAGARGAVGEIGQQLGRFSIAQAEYYLQGPPVPREEWLWSMKWSARLRHFRMPSDHEQNEEQERQDRSAGSTGDKVAKFVGSENSSAGSAEDACALAGGRQCREARDSLTIFDRLVRH